MELAHSVGVGREPEREHRHGEVLFTVVLLNLAQSEHVVDRETQGPGVVGQVALDQLAGKNVVPRGNGGVGREHVARGHDFTRIVEAEAVLFHEITHSLEREKG